MKNVVPGVWSGHCAGQPVKIVAVAINPNQFSKPGSENRPPKYYRQICVLNHKIVQYKYRNKDPS